MTRDAPLADPAEFTERPAVDGAGDGAGDGNGEPSAEQLRARSPAAFEWLVRRTQRIVLGLGQSVGLRGADLDDGAAETYLAVYRALPAFEARSAVTTWVYRIAARTLTRTRSTLRGRPTEPLAATVADPRAATPDALAGDRERDEAVWAAVATLEPRSAMVVELYYRRDWPVDAIADALDCPTGTVKTLLFRARDHLRGLLTAERAS